MKYYHGGHVSVLRIFQVIIHDVNKIMHHEMYISQKNCQKLPTDKNFQSFLMLYIFKLPSFFNFFICLEV